MKENNKNTKQKSIIILTIILFTLLIIGIFTCINYDSIRNIISNLVIKEETIEKNEEGIENEKKQDYDSIVNHTTIKNERLVIKSLSAYNKIIEYKFKDDTLKLVTIYEQFEEKEKFENKRANYEKQKNIIIKNINQKDLSIEYEKKDFGSDKGLSYKKIYNKYLVQIIGAYEKM